MTCNLRLPVSLRHPVYLMHPAKTFNGNNSERDDCTKRETNYMALLRKMTYRDKAPYASAPPCIQYASRQKHSTATITREMTVHKERWWYIKAREIYETAGKMRDYYGVATMNRLLRIIGLLCRRALEKRLYSAKETYILKEPTNCSHPIYKIDREMIYGTQ